MNQAKLLVIDNDEGTTELLELLLSPLAVQLIHARNGVDGIALIRKVNPHVIIFDPTLPGGNGWSTCQTLREISDAPILVVSPLDSPDIVAQVLDAGADDYLVKPLASNILLARINKLLRRTQLSTTGPLALR